MSAERISGIYAIYNIVNGKFYIGSAVSFSYRFNEHERKLRKNRHTNPHLQAAWNKYWFSSFQFLIIEYCEPNKLLEREQWWIDLTQAYKYGYNRNPTAGSSLGYKRSIETRIKLSKAHAGKTLSEEHRKKISQNNKGRKHTEEAKRKMSEARIERERTCIGIRVKYICVDGYKCKCKDCRKKKAEYARNWRNQRR